MGKIMADLSLKLSADVAELKKGLESANNNVNKFRKETEGNFSKLSGVFTTFQKSVGIIGLAIGALGGTIKIFKKIIDSTETSADQFERAMTKASTAVSYFFKTIASGDWDDFIKHLKEAAKKAGEYADTMDTLGDRERSMRILSKAHREELNKEYLIYSNMNNTSKDRIDALDRYKENAKKWFGEEKKIASDRLKAELENASRLAGIPTESIKNLIKYYKDYYNNIAKVKKAKEDIIELDNQRKVEISKATPIKGTPEGIMTSGVQDMDAVARANNKYDESVKNIMNTLTDTEKIIFKNIDGYEKLSSSVGGDLDKIEKDLNLVEDAQLGLDDALKTTLKTENRLSKEGDKNADKKQKELEDEIRLRKEIIYLMQNEAPQMISSPLVKYTTLNPQTPSPITTSSPNRAEQYAAIPEGNQEMQYQMRLSWAKEDLAAGVITFKDFLGTLNENGALFSQEFMGHFDVMANGISDILSKVNDMYSKQMDAELKMAGNNEKKKEQIIKEYAKKQQKIATIMAIIKTAQAVAGALADYPFPYSLIPAALVAIAGGIEIGTIKSQTFAKGGIVGGTSFTGDQVPILANSGEMMINKNQQTQMFNLLNRKGSSMNNELYGTIRVDGQDLLLAITNAEKFKNIY